MKAELLLRRRVVLAEAVFAELVLWQLPKPVPGSRHGYKYRLALVSEGVCVMRYDSEAGKGDHRHYGASEEPYAFTSVDRLLEDFEHDIESWLTKNRHSKSGRSE